MRTTSAAPGSALLPCLVPHLRRGSATPALAAARIVRREIVRRRPIAACANFIAAVGSAFEHGRELAERLAVMRGCGESAARCARAGSTATTSVASRSTRDPYPQLAASRRSHYVSVASAKLRLPAMMRRARRTCLGRCVSGPGRQRNAMPSVVQARRRCGDPLSRRFAVTSRPAAATAWPPPRSARRRSPASRSRDRPPSRRARSGRSAACPAAACPASYSAQISLP